MFLKKVNLFLYTPPFFIFLYSGMPPPIDVESSIL